MNVAKRGFTLIELLVVIAIIAILAGISIPALKSLAKSNDQSQATNVVRSMIASARSIAVAQHRMAGVVFFEETGQYSLPVNASQTAMQLFVEDYNQQQYGTVPAGATVFVSYSAERQYLPGGIKLAALNDTMAGASASASINTAENADTSHRARVIMFDSTGQLMLRNGLATPNLAGAPGTYPQAYGDWHFFNSPNVTDASSAPGFFLYSKTDYDAQSFGTGAVGEVNRAKWLLSHSDVVIVNSYTGNVVR